MWPVIPVILNGIFSFVYLYTLIDMSQTTAQFDNYFTVKDLV
jgi:hypothetical protein